MNDIHLDWIEGLPALLAAARAGSASAAATALNTTTATVIRRISKMEDALGVRLFDRHPAGLSATAALEVVLPWAEQMEAAAIGLVTQLGGLETRAEGLVKVAAVPVVSSQFIAPALPTLLARHPDLVVELLPGSAVVDLVRREADVAIRLARPTRGELVSKRLVAYRSCVAASSALLKRVRPKRLRDLPWLSWSADMDDLPEARWLAQAVPEPNIVLRSPDLVSLMRAARAGAGAIVLGEPVVDASPELTRVELTDSSEAPELPGAELWIAAHQALRPVPRVAAVWDWLVEAFGQPPRAAIGA